MRRTVFVLVLVAAMVGSPIASVAALEAPGVTSAERLSGGHGVAQDVPENQVLNATEEVKVWERSVLTLRTDTSNAAYTVDNAVWDVELEGVGEKSLNKPEIAVYQVDDAIDVRFDEEPAAGDFGGDELHFMAARLEGNQSRTLSSFSTLEDVEGLLTHENANDNASFTSIDDSVEVSSTGEASLDWAPSKPGQYVFFVTTTDNGEIGASPGEYGDIEHESGNVTVVGVDYAVVRRGNPSVSAGQNQYDAGDDVTFSADTSSVIDNSAGENTSHAILLYDQGVYTDAEFGLAADGHLDEDFDVSENITLEHSIESVNGVQRSVGNPTAFGITAESGTAEGDIELGNVLNFLVQNTSFSSSLQPNTSLDTSGSTAPLDASMTVVNGTDEEDVDVTTRSGWREACYRWIHVATNESGTEFASTTGEVGIGTSCDTGDDDDGFTGGGGSDDDDDGTTSADGTSVESSNVQRATVTSVGREVSVEIVGAEPDSTVEVQRPTAEVADEVERHGSALEEMETTFTQETDFDMTVTRSNSKPDPNVPDPPSDRGTAGYIDVQHSASDESIGEVRFTFRVSESRLDQMDVGTDEVVLYRYDGTEWSELETEFLGRADDGTPRFAGTSPGLSIFAIGARETPEPTVTATDTEMETDAGTATETDRETPTETETPGGLPGFTAALAVLALLAAALLARRRKA